MKITIEIPDALFRRAKAEAAKRGIPLRQFVTEAVAARLDVASAKASKPWMKYFGKLKRLRKETRSINKAVEDAFEKIDTEL